MASYYAVLDTYRPVSKN